MDSRQQLTLLEKESHYCNRVSQLMALITYCVHTENTEAMFTQTMETANGMAADCLAELPPSSLLAHALVVLIRFYQKLGEDSIAYRNQFETDMVNMLDLFMAKKITKQLKAYSELVLLALHAIYEYLSDSYEEQHLDNARAIVLLNRLYKLRCILEKYVEDPDQLTHSQTHFVNYFYGLLTFQPYFVSKLLVKQRNFTIQPPKKDESTSLQTQLNNLQCHLRYLSGFLDRKEFCTHLDRIKKSITPHEDDMLGDGLAHALLTFQHANVIMSNNEFLPEQTQSKSGMAMNYETALSKVLAMNVIEQLVRLKAVSKPKPFNISDDFTMADFARPLLFHEALLCYLTFLDKADFFISEKLVHLAIPEIYDNISHPKWEQLHTLLRFQHRILHDKTQFHKIFSHYAKQIQMPASIDQFVEPNALTICMKRITEMQQQLDERHLQYRQLCSELDHQEQLRKAAIRERKHVLKYGKNEDAEEEVLPDEPEEQDTVEPDDKVEQKDTVHSLLRSHPPQFPKAQVLAATMVKHAKARNIPHELIEAYSCLADTYYYWAMASSDKKKKAANFSLAVRFYKDCSSELDKFFAQGNQDEEMKSLQALILDRITPVENAETVTQEAAPLEEFRPMPVMVAKRLPTPLVQLVEAKPVTNLTSQTWHFNLPKEVTSILEALRSRGYVAWLTGGAVRDFLMDCEPNDYDIVTTAPMNELTEITGMKGKLVGQYHPVFSLCNIQIAGMTTTVHSANPEQVMMDNQSIVTQHRTTNLKENIKRRDFTCNTLYYDDINHTIIDLCNGVDAIRKRKLVFVNPTQEAVYKDASLILRAIRLCSSRGFKLKKSDQRCMKRLAPRLHSPLSPAKLNFEMQKTLMTLFSNQSLHLIRHYGLWKNAFNMTDEAAKRCEKAIATLFTKDNLSFAYELCWSLIALDRFEACIKVDNYDYALLAKNYLEFFKRIFTSLGIAPQYYQSIAQIYISYVMQTKQPPILVKPSWITKEAYDLATELKTLVLSPSSPSPLGTVGLFKPSAAKDSTALKPPTTPAFGSQK